MSETHTYTFEWTDEQADAVYGALLVSFHPKDLLRIAGQLVNRQPEPWKVGDWFTSLGHEYRIVNITGEWATGITQDPDAGKPLTYTGTVTGLGSDGNVVRCPPPDWWEGDR